MYIFILPTLSHRMTPITRSKARETTPNVLLLKAIVLAERRSNSLETTTMLAHHRRYDPNLIGLCSTRQFVY